MPWKASVIPTKLPATGVACRMSRATATGIRLTPPTLRLVGSEVIQPAPGTKTPPACVEPASATPRCSNQIYLQAVSADAVQSAIRQITATLQRRHRIKPGDTADFAVRNLSQIAETAESSSRIMALLLAAVASISLLVGGIGIMNILLVSVTERTREIGLRMASGARRLHVLLQFLAEAVLISVSGGIAGIAIGVALSQVVSFAAGWPAPVSAVAIVGGFLFSAAVGNLLRRPSRTQGSASRPDRGAA